MPEEICHAFAINRRRLLASAAAATTAALAPPFGEPGEAAAIQTEPLAPGVAAQSFSAANAKRLLEIARRNSLRKEAGLPLLSVSKEIRLMKSVEAAERFARFSEALRHRIRDNALARTRRWQNDPNWKPKDKWESSTFEREVNQRLTRLFTRFG
jgi:hypothetical protein